MKPSKENPDYSVVLNISNTERYEITPIIVSLELSHQKEQLAQTATITVMNIKYKNSWPNAMFQVRQRVFIYANDGERHEEVFRGWIWSTSYTSATESRELVLRCYDNLVYLQESEESAFFPAGYATKDVVANLFSRWGIPLQYNYTGITHSKLALRGALADLITSDVLDPVRKQTGLKPAIVMEKDTVVIRTAGDNETFYAVVGASNAIHTKSGATMDGMTTQVVILGTSDNAGKTPVEAIVAGDTAKWGTLQKLQDRDQDTTLANAKAEAQTIIDESGKPKQEYELRCSDIPWVRKGDKIYVSVGGIYNKTLIVWGIDRQISDEHRDMTLTMEDP